MKLELTPETYEQRQSKQIAALCRFAGAVEKLAKLNTITSAEALVKIREEIRRLNISMDWQELP